MRTWQRSIRRLSARVDHLFDRVHRDEGGNVIVIYIAAALLLIGMLWAIIGSGARYVQKETLQTSADAAAFSAAVIKAKGLNMIAFCNLVMAVLLAIIIMLRAIKGALLTLSAICTVCCDPYTYYAPLCGISPEVDTIKAYYDQLYDRLEPLMLNAMKGMARVERAVNKTYPALALIEAAQVGTHDEYKKNFGKSLSTVIWPLPVGQDMSLPTEDGTWDDLCDHAMDVVTKAQGGVNGRVAVPPPGDAIFKAQVVKSYLCDVDGDQPLPLKLTSDWKDHKDVRAYSILADANVDTRRKSVNVSAFKKKSASPTMKQLMATAQAEFYPHYGSGHDDLWHMDWRARLIRFTLASSTDGDASSGVGAFMQFLSQSGAGALADQFMVH